jgi:S1-C subfamily serine protease
VQLYDGSPLLGAGIRGAQREEIIGNQRVFTGGDLLTAIDGRPIDAIADLEMLLESNYRIGDVVTITLIREGRTMETQVELVEEPR